LRPMDSHAQTIERYSQILKRKRLPSNAKPK
jgi:hypothetical protein